MLSAPARFVLCLLFVVIFSTSVFSQQQVGQTSETKTQSSNEATEGVVRLRVTFLASGEAGEITVLQGLPNGLTERAVEAARKIKIDPPKKDGVPLSTTKTVEYRFSLIFDEDAEEIQKKAKITRMPAPKRPKGENLKKLGGKVELTLELFPSGEIGVVAVKTDLPQAFQDEARKAAAKIKFEPAIHKNGNTVTQQKKIEYEFKPE